MYNTIKSKVGNVDGQKIDQSCVHVTSITTCTTDKLIYIVLMYNFINIYGYINQCIKFLADEQVNLRVHTIVILTKHELCSRTIE